MLLWRHLDAAGAKQKRVWSGGQTKNVTITAGKGSELYKSEGRFRYGPMTMGFVTSGMDHCVKSWVPAHR